MTIFLILLLTVITILVITYPLFFQKIVDYLSEQDTSSDFNEQNALLSALSDLEEEYQLGRLSEPDYERLKLHFQRRYLEYKTTDLSKKP